MSQIRTTAVEIRNEPIRAWMYGGAQALSEALGQAGRWLGETAQQFASLLSDLMGPAVFLAYSFAAWSFASNLGWTSAFLVSSGPLSNWLVWLVFAIVINIAASILKRRTQNETARIGE